MENNMDYINLSDELRKKLIAEAKWQDSGVPLNEGTETKPVKSKKAKAVKQEEEVVEEEVEGHVCPLCSSHLEEEIGDDELLEHASLMLAILEKVEALNEGQEEDEDFDLADQIIEEVLSEGEEDEDEDDEEEYEEEDEEDEEEEE